MTWVDRFMEIFGFTPANEQEVVLKHNGLYLWQVYHVRGPKWTADINQAYRMNESEANEIMLWLREICDIVREEDSLIWQTLPTSSRQRSANKPG